jgi:ABC-2 type transport system permease protein
MSAALRAYRSLTTANLRMYLRNPVASFSAAGGLVILLVAVKVVLGGEGVHTRVVVADSSGGADAAALVTAVRAVGTFDVSVVSPAAAHAMLDQGQADLEVAIPPGFATRDASGRPVPVSLAVTYRAGSAGESSVPTVEGAVAGYDRTVLGEVPTVSVSASAVHTRATGAGDFLLPGVVAFNIIAGALMLAAGIFANYKSTGVLRRLQATGISPSIFVLSHATSSFVLGMLQTAAILLIATLLFSVHLDIPSLFLLLALGYLVFLAMGLAISGWIRDAQRATAVAQSVAFPLIFVALLSAALPPGLAAVTKYLPVSYITDGMQHLSNGGQLASVAPDLAWLSGWAILLLAAAGRAFRWQ